MTIEEAAASLQRELGIPDQIVVGVVTTSPRAGLMVYIKPGVAVRVPNYWPTLTGLPRQDNYPVYYTHLDILPEPL